MGVTEKHRFDVISRLAWEKELTSIGNCIDIKALLTRWKHEGEILPEWLGEHVCVTDARALTRRAV